MIPLDPEEIAASGCWETISRVFLAFCFLALAPLFAATSALATSAISSLLPVSFYFGGTPPFLETLTLILVALAIAGVFGGGILSLILFARDGVPERKRLIALATMQHLSFTILMLGSVTYSGEIIETAVFLIFQIGFLGLIIYTTIFLQNFLRVRHEQHLMTVAAENAVRRHQLNKKIHIPPPPAGTKPPQPRPLSNPEKPTKTDP
ncbi:MAG: hypothetical protein AAGC74_05875 [Verrucomicrobiota bacterium]